MLDSEVAIGTRAVGAAHISPKMDVGSSLQSVRSQALAGEGAERGSSGEHTMKIIERDVAGASCGEAYHAHKERRRRAAAAQRRGF